MKDANLTDLTVKSLRIKLEEYFRCDLIEKKDVIKRLLNKYIDDNIELIEYNERIEKEKEMLHADKSNNRNTNDKQDSSSDDVNKDGMLFLSHNHFTLDYLH